MLDIICQGHYGAENSAVDQVTLDRFLASVERRAFLMARSALGNEEDALDTVQDAMMLLVRKYRHKSTDEWRLLFFRILNNRIRDVIRKRTVRNRFSGWLGYFSADEDDQQDPFQQVPDRESNNPARDVERTQSMEALNDALVELPPRQREAFMLRCWEGLSTDETATVMGCSQGSVKTHYSRAMHVLQAKLKEHYND